MSSHIILVFFFFCYRCLWNCGRHNYESNPDSITYLLITAESEAADVIDDFYWTFDEDGYKEQNASIIAQDNIPNFILIVQNGAFFEGKKYTITATSQYYSVYIVELVVEKSPIEHYFINTVQYTEP